MSNKRVTAVTIASLAVALVSLILLPPAIRGLGMLVGFSALSALFLFGGVPMASRRLAIAFGLYMLVCAIKFGADFSDFPRSRTFTTASTLCLIAAVAWFIFESRRVKGRKPTQSHNA